jgi:tRNA(Ile2) C34 agmatinyltransferase TiaS
MASRNDITGDIIKSRISNQEFEDNFDLIFRKNEPMQLELDFGDDPLCKLCGKTLKAKGNECAYTACPLNWDEARVDIIGQNGPTGEHYEEIK